MRGMVDVWGKKDVRVNGGERGVDSVGGEGGRDRCLRIVRSM